MDLNQISAETLDEIKKATTAGVNISTGLQGVDLSDVVSLIPVNTPFYNQLPKTSPEQGARFAQWRALTNVNNTQPDPGTPYDYAAPLVNISEIDVAAAYGKIGTGYTVTKDAINRAKGYADAKAIALFNCLNQYKIAADKKLLGGQSFALAAPTGVTVVPSTTGGSIPASTQVQVQVAARTLSNYNYGGSGAATAIVSATTSNAGGTNSAVATVTAVRGAVAYDWFVGGFYLTTTTVNKVTITTIPTANQPVPLLPGIYAVAPAAVPTVDGSAKPNDFNGLLASLAGDYALPGSYGQVTAGQGVPSGATFQSLDGAGFTINGANVAELDRLNAAIYASVQLSPTAYMMSSQTASELSGGLLTSAAGAVTMFAPNEAAQRTDVVAGGNVSWYINKSTGGTPIEIEIHPNLAPGILIARTDTVPFPNSNITNTLEQRDEAPVSDYEYGVSRVQGVAGGGPRFDGETSSSTTLVNRAPVAMGVISNIG
ncbi:hypothetical protein LQK89_02720 [Curtobacterium sp. C1]|uniref:hypothetical protein n=1 Tax=Curtobacterium sp. C1 TaxID=2898151 RepID=UPI001E4F42BE|nr:hypothetical protein [Curtobacterium sp. C1]UFU14632.1 hypothetical protein LQK89_02720 [Curtobacterium sp. C1]